MFRKLLKIWTEDSLLNAAIKTASEMFEENNKIVEDSLNSLINNKQFEFDVYKEDQRINHFEKDIRKKVLEHLTINPKEDVAASLILLGVVRDIERIGDYAKNYFELDKLYDKKFEGNKYADRLVVAKDEFTKQSHSTKQVFADGDPEAAKEIINWYYDGFSPKVNQIIEEVMKDKLEDQDAVAYALLSGYLKRSAAHLANIASSVSNPFHKIGFGTKNRKEVEIRS